VAGREPAATAAADVPPDLVELGAVSGAYGVKGWVRIALFGSEGSVLLDSEDWWLMQEGRSSRVTPEARRRYGKSVLAKWSGCESREAADQLRGVVVAVPRREFPPVSEGSYYWVDLLGCQVLNRGGDDLGQVSGLRENAGGQWLEIRDHRTAGVLLIPLVEQFVEAVDPTARVIRVDWERDW
jgi:16S rRNA processing protein RimM